MILDLERVPRQVLIALAIALSWVGLFNLNEWLFSDLEHTIRAHWIFLPALLRPLCILLFGGTGAWGLVLGTYFTAYGTTNGDYLHEINLALLSGMIPGATVYVAKKRFKIPNSLTGLQASHIVLICTLCAGANALGLNAYLWLSGQLVHDMVQILTVFIGDLLGAMILLMIISTILEFSLPRKFNL